MPILKKMSAPPPEPPKRKSSGQVGKTTGFKSQQIKDPAARRRPITADIYGEELLKPVFKKEKEIAVCFYPFTKNDLRISTDGKFIIERFSVDDLQELQSGEKVLYPSSHWNLFYYKEPIKDFVIPNSEDEFKNIIYEIKPDECEKFNDISSVTDLSNKVIELIRAEYFEEKQEIKRQLQEKERLEKEKEDESEGIIESEISGEFQKEEEESEVLSEITTETTNGEIQENKEA